MINNAKNENQLLIQLQENDNPNQKGNINSTFSSNQSCKGKETNNNFSPVHSGTGNQEKTQGTTKTDNNLVNSINSEPASKLDEENSKKFYNHYNQNNNQNNQNGHFYNNSQPTSQTSQKPNFYNNVNNKSSLIANNNFSNTTNIQSPIIKNQNYQNNSNQGQGYNNYYSQVPLSNNNSNYQTQGIQPGQGSQNALVPNSFSNNQYNSNNSNKYYQNQPYQQIVSGNNTQNPASQPSKNIQVNISLNNQYNKEISREVQKTINNNMTGSNMDNSGFSNPIPKEFEIPGYNDFRLDTNILTTQTVTKSNENKKNFGKLLKETLNDYVINRENIKFSELFKNISIDGCSEDSQGGDKTNSKKEIQMVNMPLYYIDDIKTYSQEKLQNEKEIKGIKQEITYFKKKKDNENTEIKKLKESSFKLDLSREVLKTRQKEIRKKLDDILSEIF
jgi:hypothetical protein